MVKAKDDSPQKKIAHRSAAFSTTKQEKQETEEIKSPKKQRKILTAEGWKRRKIKEQKSAP